LALGADLATAEKAITQLTPAIVGAEEIAPPVAALDTYEGARRASS
jgi:hypothetical protein